MIPKQIDRERKIFTVHEDEQMIFTVHKWEQAIFTVHNDIAICTFFENLTRFNEK